MRPVSTILTLALAAFPAFAQPAGSLPPPVPRAVEPPQAAAPPPYSNTTREPGVAERSGAAIDRAADQTGQALGRAAEETGSALGRAMRWTGERMQGAGDWTARQGERMAAPPPAERTAPRE